MQILSRKHLNRFAKLVLYLRIVYYIGSVCTSTELKIISTTRLLLLFSEFRMPFEFSMRFDIVNTPMSDVEHFLAQITKRLMLFGFNGC